MSQFGASCSLVKLRMSLLLATFGGLAAISGEERPNQGTSSWGREAMRLHTHALIKISVVVIIDSRSSMIKIVIISLKFHCFDQNSPHKCTKVTYIQKTLVVWESQWHLPVVYVAGLNERPHNDHLLSRSGRGLNGEI